MDIVNQILIPALDKVGADFEKGKLFLPQLIQSATTAQEAFDVIKKHMASRKDSQTVSRGKVIIATVKEMCIRDRRKRRDCCRRIKNSHLYKKRVFEKISDTLFETFNFQRIYMRALHSKQ